MATRNRLAIGAVVVVAGIVALAWTLAGRTESRAKPPLALMTSLPIYWGSGDAFDAALSGEAEPHRVRRFLERRYALVPLDTLSAPEEAEPSAELRRLQTLILAQPRALAPADFAALDIWVRGGGRALLFVDPMLTEHSEFGIGDPRRPEAIALMSPILARWGLQQSFDEAQDEGVRAISYKNVRLPIEQTGRFEWTKVEGANCDIAGDGVVAECSIGQGRVLIVSDAALLDGETSGAEYDEALKTLLDSAFGAGE